MLYHGDHLGSSSVTTDENGDVIENTTYSPFGEVLSGGSSRFDYEGKEQDGVVNDIDFDFRKYKPQWAMFTQPDTLIQNVYDPQSLNRYMFERGNPYRNVDQSGHDYFDDINSFGPISFINSYVVTAVDVVKSGFRSIKYNFLWAKAMFKGHFKISIKMNSKSFGNTVTLPLQIFEGSNIGQPGKREYNEEGTLVFKHTQYGSSGIQ